MSPRLRSLPRLCAVLFGTLLLSWPALYNRYPLLFPDSMSYIESGPRVARALFLRDPSGYYGVRSFLYALGIAPFHLASPWPIVFLQSLLAAYIVWLTVRAFAPRRTTLAYLATIVPLALFTGLPWVSSIVMPDILGALLYLAVFLLVFAPHTLSRPERVALILIAWWSAAAHVTHLMLATGLILFLLASLAVFRALTRPRLIGLLSTAAIILAAILSHMAVHGILYGKPSLNGERPPYLTARLLSDGTGRRYLLEHCPQARLALCGFTSNLPDNPDDFLWDASGIWQSASPEVQTLILRQEMPFALATIRAYPRQQRAISTHAFLQQLTSFGISNGANAWLLDEFPTALPGQRPFYQRSRQAQDALPNEFLSTVQDLTVLASLAALVILAPFIFRRPPPQLIGLTAVIFSTVTANALVTAVLAEVDDRYQTRVIWLLPLLAALYLLELLHQRRAAATPAPAPVAVSA